MIVLDVLFYSQVPNPDGLPADWPASCAEVEDTAPVTPGRTRMTQTQYAAYRAARQAGYDAWLVQYRLAQEAARAAEALEQARAAAQAAFDAATDKYELMIKAAVLEIVRYVNQGAGQANGLIDWLNTQTALNQRSQLAGLKIDRSAASIILANAKAKVANREAG